MFRYYYVRHAWILEAMREIRTLRTIGIDLINFHANLNGMFYEEKRRDPFGIPEAAMQ